MESHQLINQTSGLTEYYTPPELIEPARQLMRRIDLDPASCEFANTRYVKADRIFTKEDNGLAQKWFGRIWMNHPFGKAENPCKYPCTKETCKKRGHHLSEYLPGNADWINKLLEEHRAGRVIEACCITFAATSEEWFRPLLVRPQCYLIPRTNYIGPDGKPVKGVSKGSVITYFGRNVDGFYHAYKKFGEIRVNYSACAALAEFATVSGPSEACLRRNLRV